MNSQIVASKSTYSELYENLSLSMDPFCSTINGCRTISIKINLCDARTADTGAITHPLFLDALLRYLRETLGDSVTINVVESDATVASPDLFIEWFGFLPVLKRWNANYINLSKDKKILKKIDGRVFHNLTVPLTIAQSDCFISLAKLKTISSTKITCALKNQFGCIPYKKKIQLHAYLDDAIVDANLAMPPDLSIVDGIIAHVGDKGPTFGRPIPANIFVVGNDPVAVDSFCAKMLGFNPFFVGHIRKAARAKVGSMDNYSIKFSGLSKMPHIDSEFNMPEVYLTKIAVRLLKRK